jgi:multidrug transporter EmrE-like cation transporter
VTVSTPVLLGVTIALNVLGQYLLKAGTGRVALVLSEWLRIVTNPELLLGLAAYVVSLVAWLLVLKRMPLAVAYPTLSLSYLLIVLVGVVVLGEPLNWNRLVGSGLIVLGVWFMWRPA